MSPLQSFTKLLVADLERSVRFYEALGFRRVGADGTFTHLAWEPHGHVMFVRRPAGVRLDGPVGLGVIVCFASETPLESMLERAAAAGATTEGPRTQPWNTRELIVVDPDGYRLNFLAPVS